MTSVTMDPLPDDWREDSVEQRRQRAREHKMKFLETWRQHSLTLPSERRKVVEKLLENGGERGIICIGYHFSLTRKWGPTTAKQIAIWDGNPYACGFKEPWEIYDEMFPK